MINIYWYLKTTLKNWGWDRAHLLHWPQCHSNDSNHLTLPHSQTPLTAKQTIQNTAISTQSNQYISTTSNMNINKINLNIMNIMVSHVFTCILWILSHCWPVCILSVSSLFWDFATPQCFYKIFFFCLSIYF